MTNMDVSVVIVGRNAKEKLRECLRSVFAQTGAAFEAIVVDDASDDGSMEMVMKEFPKTTIIANTRILGSAEASNAAFSTSSGEFLLLLDPGAVLTGNDALMRMTECLRLRAKVGVLGPRVVGREGNVLPSTRRFPTPWSQMLVMLRLHHAFLKSSALRGYFMDGFDADEEANVEQVSGTAIFVRRTLVEAIGLFEGAFSPWFERVDLCKRARNAGWEVRYAPVATVRFAEGGPFAQAKSVVEQRLFNSGLRRYMMRHYGLFAAVVVAMLSPLSLMIAWFSQTFMSSRSSYADHS